jgi:hypothetical protein
MTAGWFLSHVWHTSQRCISDFRRCALMVVVGFAVKEEEEVERRVVPEVGRKIV